MAIPTLAAIVLSAIGSLPVTIPQERATSIAEDIAVAVDTAEALPLDGEARKEASVLMMVGLGFNESRFDERAELCEIRGALGELTAWQLMPGTNLGGHSRKAVCSDRRLAASLAIKVLVRARPQTRTVPGLLRAYTSGSVNIDSFQARARVATFSRLCKSAGVKMHGVEATWPPEAAVAWN